MPYSHAVPRPRVARIKGNPQHEATENAATRPQAVSSTAPLPRAGARVSGGSPEKTVGMVRSLIEDSNEFYGL
jgi:hypothetical protein